MSDNFDKLDDGYKRLKKQINDVLIKYYGHSEMRKDIDNNVILEILLLISNHELEVIEDLKTVKRRILYEQRI